MQTTRNDEKTINLAQYLQIVLRRKWFILLFLLIAILLAAGRNAKLVPIYRSTCTLIIDRESGRSPLTGQRMDYESYLSESLTFKTHFELITSRPVMERTIKKLKLDKGEKAKGELESSTESFIGGFFTRLKNNLRILLKGGIKETPRPKDKMTGLVKSLASKITIEPIEDTRLLNLIVIHTDPEMASDIANTVAQSYIEFNIDNRMKASQNTLKWLTNNLYEIKGNLEGAEEEFSSFKQEARLISVEKGQEMIAMKIREINGAYIQARNKRLELDARLDQLEKMASKKGNISPFRSLIENQLIDSLYAELVNTEVELSKASKIYKEKHPKYIQIQTKINDIKGQLGNEVKKEMANLKAERSVLGTKEKVLQDTINDLEKEAMDLGKKELDHDILKRNVQMNENLYDTILSRLKEADLTDNLDVSNIRIVEGATIPRAPIGPNKKRNLILAAIFGLMLGIGISFLWEYMDRTLRTEEDVQNYLNLPVLSVIPSVDKKMMKAEKTKE